MSKRIPINLNDYIDVKLSAKGREIHDRYWRGLGVIPPDLGPLTDTAGYTRFQIHELMCLFGGDMWRGNPDLPFEVMTAFIERVTYSPVPIPIPDPPPPADATPAP